MTLTTNIELRQVAAEVTLVRVRTGSSDRIVEASHDELVHSRGPFYRSTSVAPPAAATTGAITV